MTDETEATVAEPTVRDADAIVAALGRLDDAGLGEIVMAVTAVGYPYLVARSPAAAYIGAMLPDLGPATYEDGRAFGPAGELRWQREEWLAGGALRRGWRAVFVGGRDACPLDTARADVLPLGGHTQRQVTARLWGERRAGQSVWTEPRIPRMFDYGPLVAGRPERVGVVVVQYILRGQVDFVRFLGFSRWPGQEGGDGQS